MIFNIRNGNCKFKENSHHRTISLHCKNFNNKIKGIVYHTPRSVNKILIIRNLSTLKYDRSVTIVQEHYLIKYPVNPISDSLLFSPKYTGSLYSILSLKVLEIINHKSANVAEPSLALIPIIEVIDLALDPSGVFRKYKNKSIVYL